MRALLLLLLTGCQPLDLLLPCEVQGYQDDDRDGFGRADAPSCTTGDNIAPVAGDCDDTDPAVHPETAWRPDADGDGFGDASTVAHTGCTPPPDVVADASDCDDADAAVHPDATEDCSAVDRDCSGDALDVTGDAAPAWYEDADGDGYGDRQLGRSCDAPQDDASMDGGDCDDDDPTRSPGVVEACDGLDNDCSGVADDNVPEEDRPVWYADEDGDGHGDPDAPAYACEAPSGHVASADDCDDLHADIVGEADYPVDPDGDGYGADGAETLRGCGPPEGAAHFYGDCLEGDASVNPDGTEVCGNGLDDDCDGDPFPCAPEGTVALADLDTVELQHDTPLLDAISLGDMDGDGADELAIQTGGSTANSVLFLGGVPASDASLDAETVTLAATTGTTLLGTAMAAGDLDGDGYADVLLSAQASSGGWVGIGYGPALPEGAAGTDLDVWTYDTVRDFGVSLAAADLSGDGRADAVVLDGRGAVLVFDDPASHGVTRSDASATVQAASSTPEGVVRTPGDLDGDGFEDLLFRRSELDETLLFPGPLDGTFTSADATTILDDGSYEGDVVEGEFCDFDGDGHLDGWSRLSRTGLSDDAALLHLGPVTAAGWSTPEALVIERTSSSAPGSSNFALGVVCGDFDGDGAADIQLVDGGTSGTDPTMFWYRDIGSSGVFGPTDATATQTGAGFQWLGAGVRAHGDFDGDGVSDLAAAESGATPVVLLLLGSGL